MIFRQDVQKKDRISPSGTEPFVKFYTIIPFIKTFLVKKVVFLQKQPIIFSVFNKCRKL